MDLRQYLGLFRKWSWLIFLITALAAGSSFFYSRTIPPSYHAETTLLVGQLQQDSQVSNNELSAANNLVQAYTLLVTQPAILQATAEAIRWPEPWQTLFFHVSANASGGQLLKISATDKDPRRVQAIADELAHQLVLQGPIGQQDKESVEERNFIANQRAMLRTQIENGQKTLSDLNAQATLENDPEKLNDLNTRIAALQGKVNEWQKNYAALATLAKEGSDKFLTILAPARVPTAPVSPNIPQNVLLATVAGLALAAGIIVLLEYLDDTIKSPDDVQKALQLPTYGAIARIAGIHDSSDHLITLKHPRAPIAEAYRIVRTNLRFSGIENPAGSLLVTSAGPGEGKTTTAANLAVTLAQAGKRVILVDADLRRPSLHKFFQLSNNLGLSNLFLSDAKTPDGYLQPTWIEGLRVIPSGPVPPNPAELLDSKRMNEILESLRARADMVIFDSPPALAVADASILGSRCAGALFVVNAGRTRTAVGRHALELLKQMKVKVVGVVLNSINTRHAPDYYYNYYSYRSRKSDVNARKPAPKT